MDPEQTFIRVQERFSQMLTPKVRVTLEYLYLFIAITLFCILVVMHAKLENASTNGKNLEEISELQIGLRADITIKPSIGKVLWPSTRRSNLCVSTKGEGYLNLKFGGKCSSSAVKRKRRCRKIEVEGHAEDTCLHPRNKTTLDSYIILV